MVQQVINIGTVADDGTGDTFRGAFDKTNDNFDELFPLANNALAKTSGSPQTVTGEVDFTGGLKVNGNLVVQPTRQVVVNVLADFPTPVSSVITLAANTRYLIGDNINLGVNRIVMSDSSALTGIESTVITLTYTDTGDMITMNNVTARVSNIILSAASGRVYNWTDTVTKIGRFNDVTISACQKIGVFNGTSGILRFTNHSISSAIVDGIEFIGNFRSLLWEVSAVTMTAGALFNLGTATFDSFIATTVLGTLNGTSNFISGAAASANINTGGDGLVTANRLSGAGVPLSGVTVDDALWNFFHNDDIADTRPDGLLSMQANATATVIAVAGTPVLVAGTWVVERNSQTTGTTAGRTTYDGGKNATLPITGSFTVEPVSGGAVNISIEVAIGGVVVPNSKRTANTSAGNPVSITAPWQEVFSTTDFVEFFVTNEATTVNILVSSAIARLN